MMCPLCGKNSKVVDCVTNTVDKEIYRKHYCEQCDHTFYTTEFEVERNEAFKEAWTNNYRKRKD